MSNQPPPTMTPEELYGITGYRRAREQLAELHRQGFWRARRARLTGEVILERLHYEAVCKGTQTERPRVRLAA